MTLSILTPEDEDDASEVIRDAQGKKVIAAPKLSGRQRMLGRYLVMAGGDSKYLADIADAKRLERVIKASAIHVGSAARLAAAVRTGKVADFLDKLIEDTEGDARELKARIDGALAVLKKMLKFGVDVEVFTQARSAVQAYLKAKGHTFDDEDENTELAGEEDEAASDA